MKFDSVYLLILHEQLKDESENNLSVAIYLTI